MPGTFASATPTELMLMLSVDRPTSWLAIYKFMLKYRATLLPYATRSKTEFRQTRSSEKLLRKPSIRSIRLHWCHLPCSFILTFMDVICNVHLNIMLPLNQLYEKPYISQKSVKIKGQKYRNTFHHREKHIFFFYIWLFQLIHYPITITIT